MTNLLLVDDEIEILDALDLILSAEGYQTQARQSGQAALEVLTAPEHDQMHLIISDIIMPQMDGLALLAAVRALPRYATVPVLFISASYLPEAEANIAELDNVSFLRKPFQVDELCALVAKLCR